MTAFEDGMTVAVMIIGASSYRGAETSRMGVGVWVSSGRQAETTEAMQSVEEVWWQPGTVVVQQEYWRRAGRLVTVRPMTVVEDTEALPALYAPAGGTFRMGRWDAPSRMQLSIEDCNLFGREKIPGRPVPGAALSLRIAKQSTV
jgi:hypothetical protein